MHLFLAALVLLGAAKHDVKRAGPDALRLKADTRPLEPAESPLADADVARFLQLWPAFERAMRDAAPPVPDAAGIEAADVAWEADRRLENILREAGSTPDEFLRLYRRVAAAWWALRQQEEHDRAEAALEREMNALEKVAGKDGDRAAAEMRSHRDTHEPGRTDVPKPSLEAVAERRADLAKIFGH